MMHAFRYLLLSTSLVAAFVQPSHAGFRGDQGPVPDSLVGQGLRQALEIGATNTAKKLSALNGYFGNPAIKILMPPEAQSVENTLRRVGMGAQVDQAVLAMNRAAEQAAAAAAPIFIRAITQMNIQDAIRILDGGNHAATDYLKKSTTISLTAAFHPVVDSCLKRTDATKYWAQMFNTYNKIPFVRKVNPDLVAFVTSKALDGLFYNIALEEQKIRQDPSAQVTGLLKSVFGNR
jgi:hypothetical protein